MEMRWLVFTATLRVHACSGPCVDPSPSPSPPRLYPIRCGASISETCGAAADHVLAILVHLALRPHCDTLTLPTLARPPSSPQPRDSTHVHTPHPPYHSRTTPAFPSQALPLRVHVQPPRAAAQPRDVEHEVDGERYLRGLALGGISGGWATPTV